MEEPQETSWKTIAGYRTPTVKTFNRQDFKASTLPSIPSVKKVNSIDEVAAICQQSPWMTFWTALNLSESNCINLMKNLLLDCGDSARNFFQKLKKKPCSSFKKVYVLNKNYSPNPIDKNAALELLGEPASIFGENFLLDCKQADSEKIEKSTMNAEDLTVSKTAKQAISLLEYRGKNTDTNSSNHSGSDSNLKNNKVQKKITSLVTNIVTLRPKKPAEEREEKTDSEGSAESDSEENMKSMKPMKYNLRKKKNISNELPTEGIVNKKIAVSRKTCANSKADDKNQEEDGNIKATCAVNDSNPNQRNANGLLPDDGMSHGRNDIPSSENITPSRSEDLNNEREIDDSNKKQHSGERSPPDKSVEPPKEIASFLEVNTSSKSHNIQTSTQNNGKTNEMNDLTYRNRAGCESLTKGISSKETSVPSFKNGTNLRCGDGKIGCTDVTISSPKSKDPNLKQKQFGHSKLPMDDRFRSKNYHSIIQNNSNHITVKIMDLSYVKRNATEPPAVDERRPRDPQLRCRLSRRLSDANQLNPLIVSPRAFMTDGEKNDRQKNNCSHSNNENCISTEEKTVCQNNSDNENLNSSPGKKNLPKSSHKDVISAEEVERENNFSSSANKDNSSAMLFPISKAREINSSGTSTKHCDCVGNETCHNISIETCDGTCSAEGSSSEIEENNIFPGESIPESTHKSKIRIRKCGGKNHRRPLENMVRHTTKEASSEVGQINSFETSLEHYHSSENETCQDNSLESCDTATRSSEINPSEIERNRLSREESILEIDEQAANKSSEKLRHHKSKKSGREHGKKHRHKLYENITPHATKQVTSDDQYYYSVLSKEKAEKLKRIKKSRGIVDEEYRMPVSDAKLDYRVPDDVILNDDLDSTEDENNDSSAIDIAEKVSEPSLAISGTEKDSLPNGQILLICLDSDGEISSNEDSEINHVEVRGKNSESNNKKISETKNLLNSDCVELKREYPKNDSHQIETVICNSDVGDVSSEKDLVNSCNCPLQEEFSADKLGQEIENNCDINVGNNSEKDHSWNFEVIDKFRRSALEKFRELLNAEVATLKEQNSMLLLRKEGKVECKEINQKLKTESYINVGKHKNDLTKTEYDDDVILIENDEDVVVIENEKSSSRSLGDKVSGWRKCMRMVQQTQNTKTSNLETYTNEVGSHKDRGLIKQEKYATEDRNGCLRHHYISSKSNDATLPPKHSVENGTPFEASKTQKERRFEEVILIDESSDEDESEQNDELVQPFPSSEGGTMCFSNARSSNKRKKCLTPEEDTRASKKKMLRESVPIESVAHEPASSVSQESVSSAPHESVSSAPHESVPSVSLGSDTLQIIPSHNSPFFLSVRLRNGFIT